MSCSRCSVGPGPTGTLAREDYTTVVGMLAEGFTSRRGRRGALIHHDAVNHLLRGRRGRAPYRADLGRHHSRQRRLSGAARAGKHDHRHR